jgi:hypothetical protein
MTNEREIQLSSMLEVKSAEWIDNTYEDVANLLVSTAKENNLANFLTGYVATRSQSSSYQNVSPSMPTFCMFAEGFQNMQQPEALLVLLRLCHFGRQGTSVSKFQDQVNKYCAANDLELVHWNQYDCLRHSCGQGPDCVEPSHRMVGSMMGNKIDEYYHFVLSQGPRDASGNLIRPMLTLAGQTSFEMICDQHTHACRANDPDGPVGCIGFPSRIDTTNRAMVLSRLPFHFLEDMEKILKFDEHVALLHSSTEQSNIHNSGSTLSSDNESFSMSQALVTSSEKSDSSTSKKIEPLSSNCSSLNDHPNNEDTKPSAKKPATKSHQPSIELLSTHPLNRSTLTTSSTSMVTTGSAITMAEQCRIQRRQINHCFVSSARIRRQVEQLLPPLFLLRR